MIEINGKVYRNLQEQVAKNKLDIEELEAEVELLDPQGIAEIKSDIVQLKARTTHLENRVNQLCNEFEMSYHFNDMYTEVLEASSFNNSTMTATLESESFSLTNAIVSWSPLGERDNIDVITECGLMLLEQTEDGKITFSVTDVPTSDISIVITVYTMKVLESVGD